MKHLRTFDNFNESKQQSVNLDALTKDKNVQKLAKELANDPKKLKQAIDELIKAGLDKDVLDKAVDSLKRGGSIDNILKPEINSIKINEGAITTDSGEGIDFDVDDPEWVMMKLFPDSFTILKKGSKYTTSDGSGLRTGEDNRIVIKLGNESRAVFDETGRGDLDFDLLISLKNNGGYSNDSDEENDRIKKEAKQILDCYNKYLDMKFKHKGNENAKGGAIVGGVVGGLLVSVAAVSAFAVAPIAVVIAAIALGAAAGGGLGKLTGMR